MSGCTSVLRDVDLLQKPKIFIKRSNWSLSGVISHLGQHFGKCRPRGWGGAGQQHASIPPGVDRKCNGYHPIVYRIVVTKRFGHTLWVRRDGHTTPTIVEHGTQGVRTQASNDGRGEVQSDLRSVVGLVGAVDKQPHLGGG